MKKTNTPNGASDINRIQSSIPALLQWHRDARRPLPWRQSPTPYHVWLSEIMLQQTRIEAVIPYYHRFLEELPTVEDLAAVSDDRLMKLWQGLGYYSRARNLKKAAEILTSQYGGELPRDFQKLRALPGIGDYTAGAIASIAYGLPYPAVDGNVLRVAMRLLGSREDVMRPETRRRLTDLLRAIYPEGEDAGRLTEAWMELGEAVCIPNGAPRCAQCPLASLCRARELGIQGELPIKSPKKPKREEKKTVLLLHCNGKILLHKRPENGLLASLWEFPNTEGHLSAEEAFSLAVSLGLSPLTVEATPPATHIFTHITWNMVGYYLHCDGTPNPSLPWHTPQEIDSHFAIPTAFSAFLAYAKKQEENREN